MVEGRLVGPQFTEGFGWAEDGGADKTDLEHKVLLKLRGDGEEGRGVLTFLCVWSKSSSHFGIV